MFRLMEVFDMFFTFLHIHMMMMPGTAALAAAAPAAAAPAAATPAAAAPAAATPAAAAPYADTTEEERKIGDRTLLKLKLAKRLRKTSKKYRRKIWRKDAAADRQTRRQEEYIAERAELEYERKLYREFYEVVHIEAKDMIRDHRLCRVQDLDDLRVVERNGMKCRAIVHYDSIDLINAATRSRVITGILFYN